jgi:hypothetical protein
MKMPPNPCVREAPIDAVPNAIEIVRAAPVERVPEKVAGHVEVEPVRRAIIRIDVGM